jgi:hypothetical protein
MITLRRNVTEWERRVNNKGLIFCLRRRRETRPQSGGVGRLTSFQAKLWKGTGELGHEDYLVSASGQKFAAQERLPEKPTLSFSVRLQQMVFWGSALGFIVLPLWGRRARVPDDFPNARHRTFCGAGVQVPRKRSQNERGVGWAKAVLVFLPHRGLLE